MCVCVCVEPEGNRSHCRGGGQGLWGPHQGLAEGAHDLCDLRVLEEAALGAVEGLPGRGGRGGWRSVGTRRCGGAGRSRGAAAGDRAQAQRAQVSGVKIEVHALEHIGFRPAGSLLWFVKLWALVERGRSAAFASFQL